MSVVIANRQRVKKINRPLLEKITRELLLELKITDAELGIHLVGAREMARVNWRFLQHEGATDVITFDHSELGFRIKNSESRIYGELFVCVDEAVSQAKQFDTDWPSEVVRYIVHGVLHLLGYDDLQPELKRKMKREENRLMRLLEKKFPLANHD